MSYLVVLQMHGFQKQEAQLLPTGSTTFHAVKNYCEVTQDHSRSFEITPLSSVGKFLLVFNCN